MADECDTIDCCSDGFLDYQSDDESVRLLMEDGTYIITEDSKYLNTE